MSAEGDQALLGGVARANSGRAAPRLAIVVKGYPRLSETFIAQEILALEQRGLVLEIWSLRHPTDRYRHPMHRAIAAPCHYLPEYLHDAPLRVLRNAARALRRPALGAVLRLFWRDFCRDPTLNRIRRLGQAFVLAGELDPAIRHIHVHFLHTPGSVVRYAARLTGRNFSFSAHAKDIWTTPDWERAEKIADAEWGVTCTSEGWNELRRVAAAPDRARLHLVYHGLDLGRFPPPPAARKRRDGGDSAEPVVIVSIGRAVEKKGFGDLIDALSAIPGALAWRFVHIGSGPLLADLKAKASRLGIAGRIEWRGGQPQDEVIASLSAADLFVLPSKQGADGDRDGLPNVLMEAATQALPILSTRFAGVPEFVTDGVEGLLAPPGDPGALAARLTRLITEPDLRDRLGAAALARVRRDFSLDGGIDRLVALLAPSLATHLVA